MIYESLWSTLSEGKTWSGRMLNHRKNGEVYTVEVVYSPVYDEAGKAINYISVRRDVTEKIALEEKFHQAQKMETVGQLAGGIAHDFNNMLGIILGYAELALEDLRPDQPSHYELVEIQKAAQHSAVITRQLLTYARREPVVPVLVDLNEIFSKMTSMLEKLIGENVFLEWRLSSDLWLVKIDPGQIDQLIVNLLVNARDAILDSGEITITTENVLDTSTEKLLQVESKDREFVKLTIKDTGIGMDADVLKHIFEPFFTTKEVGEGTGLGLAMVYGMVKQNEGFVYADSSLGHGSTVTIYLPREFGSLAGLKVSEPGALYRSKGETILIVEDEKPLMLLCQDILENLGYQIKAANSSDEAKRIFQDDPQAIQLLLTDMVMPGMGGVELANHIRRLNPEVKHLFMSGHPQIFINEHDILKEKSNFIRKPFEIKALAAKVREVLDEM